MGRPDTVVAFCQLCFHERKCRVRFMGKEDNGHVCGHVECTQKHKALKGAMYEKNRAENLALRAEKAKAKEAAKAAKAAEKAAKAAPARGGPTARRRAGRRLGGGLYFAGEPAPAAVGGDASPGAAASSPEEAEDDEPDETPRPRARARGGFIDDQAGASDGVEEEEEEGNDTPESMRSFITRDDEEDEEDEEEGEAASPEVPTSVGRPRRSVAQQSPDASDASILGTPTSQQAHKRTGPQRKRLLYSSPGSGATRSRGSRAGGSTYEGSYSNAHVGRRRRTVEGTPQGPGEAATPIGETIARAADDAGEGDGQQPAAAAEPVGEEPGRAAAAEPVGEEPGRAAGGEAEGGEGPLPVNRPAIIDVGSPRCTERVMVLRVDEAASMYRVRRRNGVEEDVRFSRLSAITGAPAEAARPGANTGKTLTEWVFSITMNPQAKQGKAKAEELPDDVRMWCAQEFVLGTQELMDAWHAKGWLIEGHWGVERGDEHNEPHGQGGNRIKLDKDTDLAAENKLKAMYKPLADGVAARAKEEFRERQRAQPTKYKTLEVSMRLKLNTHANLAYLLGYTGKWHMNDEYREASTGISDERWLHCRDVYSTAACDQNNYRAVIKKPYNPRGVQNAKHNQLNKTNFIGLAVDFLQMAGLSEYDPLLVTIIAWMLQSGRFIISPIFVQERKGDAMISEEKVEALRKLTATNMAAIDIELVRLVFYSNAEMERSLEFKWRPPWLLQADVLNELTYEEVLEYKKTKTLPLRVHHLLNPSTGEAEGECLVIDMHAGFVSAPSAGCADALELLKLNNFEIRSQVWEVKAHDPDGIRAAAGAQLISACGKRELKSISKTHVFELREDAQQLNVYAATHVKKEAGAGSACAQMLRLLRVPTDVVVGPVTFDQFKRLLTEPDYRTEMGYARRYTWIVIVKLEARPVPIEEDATTTPTATQAPWCAPDCPLPGPQPYEALEDGLAAFIDNYNQEDDSPDAATELPRVLQDHHIVVAWRHENDRVLTQRLDAETEFRTRGEPSPVVHQRPGFAPGLGAAFTPGLPPGATYSGPFRPM